MEICNNKLIQNWNHDRYGLDEGTLNQTAGTVVNRYEQAHMCDYPANHSIGWRDPGFIHDGVMKGLENGKRYYYKVTI